MASRAVVVNMNLVTRSEARHAWRFKMRMLILVGLLALYGCSKPEDCKYHHTEPGKVAVRMWVPERDVYQCADNVWIYRRSK